MRGTKFLIGPGVLLAVAVLAAPVAAQTTFANDDEYTTQVNTAVAIDPLANDNIPDDATITDFFSSSPAHGEVDPGIESYTPDPAFVGDDTFTYGVCYAFLDNIRALGKSAQRRPSTKNGPLEVCDSATVTIHVLAPPATTTTVAPTTTTTVAVQVAPTTHTTPTTVAAAAELPRTGGNSRAATGIAFAAIVVGAGALGLARKRQRRTA